MDMIVETLPFFLAETCRYALIVKLKKHNVPLEHEKIFTLLCQVIFRELFGYEASELYIKKRRQNYIKRFSDNKEKAPINKSVNLSFSRYERSRTSLS